MHAEAENFLRERSEKPRAELRVTLLYYFVHRFEVSAKVTAPPVHWRWALPVAAAVLSLDLATKGAVQASFYYGERVPLTSFFNLVFVMNPGAAFSFLADAGGWQKPVLLGIGAVASIVIACMLASNRMDRLSAFGLSGILGGALGNVIDRARHGAVVDWLDFHVAGWHWPAFNIADIGIAAGAAALIAASLFSGQAEDGRRKAP